MERHRWDLESPREPRPKIPAPARVAAAMAGTRRPPVSQRRTAHGHYVPAEAPRTVEQQILDQASRLSPGQAITGWAALRLWGAGLFDGLAPDGRSALPVPLAVGTRGGNRSGPAAKVYHDRLPAEDVVDLAGVRLTTVCRATFDAVRQTRRLRPAVAALDVALGAGLLTLAEFTAWVAERRGWNGITLVRAALPLAREFTRSPQETQLRLIAELDLGITSMLVNHSVVGRQGQRGPGEVDLLDEVSGMVLEFDGADHRSADRQTRDLAKNDDAEDVGLVLARFSGADLRDRALTCRRILATRGKASFLPEDERVWLALPPKPRINSVHQERRALALSPSAHDF